MDWHFSFDLFKMSLASWLESVILNRSRQVRIRGLFIGFGFMVKNELSAVSYQFCGGCWWGHQQRLRRISFFIFHSSLFTFHSSLFTYLASYFLDQMIINGVNTAVGKSHNTMPGITEGKLSALTTRKAVSAAMYPPVIRCRCASNQ
mgnify:CR=1 FL=1